MSSTISFTKVALPYGWLGNMAPYSVIHEGKVWRTAEALFQALRFEDRSIQEAIRAEKSPMTAKMIAKKHKLMMKIAPMSPEDLANMRLVLRLKLQNNPSLRRQLLATGDARIIEDCSKRRYGTGLFWGAALRGVIWEGENQLGRLWMELRDEVRSPIVAVAG